jgi:hypothetical protein
VSALHEWAVSRAAQVPQDAKLRVLHRVRRLEVMFGEGAEGNWFDEDGDVLDALMVEGLVDSREGWAEATVYETTAKGRALL